MLTQYVSQERSVPLLLRSNFEKEITFWNQVFLLVTPRLVTSLRRAEKLKVVDERYSCTVLVNS